MSLTARQRVFVQHYVELGVATIAAQRAGYSERNASSIASRIITKTHVAAAIEAARAARAKKYEVTVERIKEEYAKLAYANMQEYMTIGEDGQPTLNWSNLTRDQAAAIASLTVEEFTDGRTSASAEGGGSRQVRRIKFTLANKRDALQDLGKHTGMFTERVSINGGAPIVMRWEQPGDGATVIEGEAQPQAVASSDNAKR